MVSADRSEGGMIVFLPIEVKKAVLALFVDLRLPQPHGE